MKETSMLTATSSRQFTLSSIIKGLGPVNLEQVQLVAANRSRLTFDVEGGEIQITGYFRIVEVRLVKREGIVSDRRFHFPYEDLGITEQSKQRYRTPTRFDCLYRYFKDKGTKLPLHLDELDHHRNYVQESFMGFTKAEFVKLVLSSLSARDHEVLDCYLRNLLNLEIIRSGYKLIFEPEAHRVVTRIEELFSPGRGRVYSLQFLDLKVKPPPLPQLTLEDIIDVEEIETINPAEILKLD